MPQQFSMRQRNNLSIGNHLIAECPSLFPGMRRFIDIWAYLPPINGRYRKVSKMLNAANQDELRFALDYYNVNAEYIDSYDADYYTNYLARQRDIANIEHLEQAVIELIDDLTLFGKVN